MQIELKKRTEETVRAYFRETRDAQVRRFLPQKAVTEAEAQAEFYKTCCPGANSFGRTIYADGCYVGDIWCYCLQDEEPNAMVSYCIFRKECWGRGIATAALRMFLAEIGAKFAAKTVGAFTFSENLASIRVLQKNGFVETETFYDDGVESKYFQRNWDNETAAG